MTRNKIAYVCTECGYDSPKWQGQCICGEWNTMVEHKVSTKKERAMIPSSSHSNGIISSPIKLNEVGENNHDRLDTGIGELNRVLGGGIVKGSLILISGEPGIGKSTIIMQAAHNLSKNEGNVVYVSGEESAEQIKMRANRICGELSEKLYVYSETNLDNIIKECDALSPTLLIIDSIQTLYSDMVDSVAGSIAQVRTCGNLLMKYAKTSGVPILIVAHVTKTGDLAGPKVVEHLVDCVLNFTGERDKEVRIIRVFKNRFGTTSEIGAFTMQEEGLVEIPDISATFLEESNEKNEGSVHAAIYEGSRPVMFEIQALTTAANVGFARRTPIGIDSQRLNMILAVLEKKAGVNLVNQDVYINVVGGVKPEGTSTDLGVALSIFSSHKRIVPSKRTLTVGEIGLTGDIRGVGNTDKIIKEAIRMGFEKIILPVKNLIPLNKNRKNTSNKLTAVNDFAFISDNALIEQITEDKLTTLLVKDDNGNIKCEICGAKSINDAIQIFSR